MKKSLLSLLLAFVLILAGCVNTKSEVSNETANDAGGEAPTIEILSMSANEDDVNIVRDQLVKNGFDVKLNLQPDYGSFTAQKEAGNFDLAVSSWTTVTGNPDYAVRALFKSDGANSIMADEKVDELIDLASTQTPEEYQETYKELEQHLVLDHAYIAPLYTSYKTQGINTEILNADSVRLAKSRALAWDSIDFADESKRETDPFIVSQEISTLTSLDPIKGNDGSINQINTNMYVRLVNLTDDDQVTAKGTLSHNFAMAEGNAEYYFLLRDDINFAKIEDQQAVDTGERVGGDDVVFSLDRASNPDSVPDHRTYSLHEHIASTEIVTDLSELDIPAASGGGTVRETLEADLENGISELVDSKNDANNAEGKYQVVKLTTTEPFPQVLNYLAHQSAGIVSKKQVESINTYDVESFDINTDIPYGDQNTVTEGSQYDNHLYASGPYILSHKNDYEAIFRKNPAFMPGTESEPNISNVSVRFIADQDSALSALRNGEIHLNYVIPETKYSVVEDDPKLELQKMESNGVRYMLFNTAENREVGTSEDLRKAVLYSINQEEFINYYQGNKIKAVSTVSPLVDTGNELIADPEKVKEYLNNYQESKK